MNRQDLLGRVLNAGVLQIRDCEAGAEPFIYSSGNRGPGYISLKHLAGDKDLIKPLVYGLARNIVAEKAAKAGIDFIAGNVTGGMIPGWLLSEYLEKMLFRSFSFTYVRPVKKLYGLKESIIGLDGCNKKGIVMEELINYAKSTLESVKILRGMGREVRYAACILFYDNPESVAALEKANVTPLYLFTLAELLDAAQKAGVFSKKLLDSFREFLADPAGWQNKYTKL
ncbi:hypothetical protein HYT01_00530 [Candidatus Giovannonibacteria bacterium]|nr:hypothetical protein [Candidatus Giovannonibacteria bacterium]